MIKTLNAIRLAKAKFHTKRRLTVLSLITSGLLFGVLMVLMMIWRPRGLIRISRTGVTPRKGVAP